MDSYSIASVPAIGAFNLAKLKAQRIRSTAGYLERTRTARQRKQLAEATRIDVELITRWAHLADLMRIRGIAGDYAELLAAAGAGTVKELRRRTAGKLATRVAEVNTEKKLVELVPSETRIARWIEVAKAMEPVVTY
jgi:hypothetical protein